jgi:Zn-dependent peptidase ImmA (M78 family)
VLTFGSHHTNISVETFRGFAIADSISPFIVINDQDARSALAFTALQELAHLWAWDYGCQWRSFRAAIEKYCKDVAGELLFTRPEIIALAQLRRAPFSRLSRSSLIFANMRTHQPWWLTSCSASKS